MNVTATPPDYGRYLSKNLRRLVADLEAAVEEGTWAVTEAAHIHAWLHAEILPWAHQTASRLDPRARGSLTACLNELAALDAELLGSVGESSARCAHQLAEATDRLLAAINPAIPHPRKPLP